VNSVSFGYCHKSFLFVFKMSKGSTELRNPCVWCAWFLKLFSRSVQVLGMWVSLGYQYTYSLTFEESVFCVTRISETPNHIGFLILASTATKTYSGWPPHFTTIYSDDWIFI